MEAEKKTSKRGSAMPPNAGKGKPPGTPNKTTKVLKEAILLAAEEVGQDGEGKDGLKGYLKRVAQKDMKSFTSLLGRVLPLTLGTEGKGIVVTVKDYTGRKRESEE